MGFKSPLVYLKWWKLCKFQEIFVYFNMSQTKPMSPFFYIPLQILEINIWIWRHIHEFGNIKIFPVKILLINQNCDTYVKIEGIFFIWACSEEKPLSVSQKISWFGGNNSSNAMTKTIIWKSRKFPSEDGFDYPKP